MLLSTQGYRPWSKASVPLTTLRENPMLSIQKESQAQAMYDLSMNLKRLGIDTSSGPEPMSDTEVIVGSFALGIGAAGLFLGGVGTSAPVVINTVLKSGARAGASARTNC